MLTPEELMRKHLTVQENEKVAAMADPRAQLEAEHGEVWDTQEMQQVFQVSGFAAPFVVVRRKADGVEGSLMFSHSPRFYYNFKEA